MTARETAARLYGDWGSFDLDELRYAGMPAGVRYCSATAFVLAHLVRVEWSIEQMKADSDTQGDCWFIWVAAGSIPEITAALAAVKVTKWVAFERGNHPHLAETTRFLNVRRIQQRTSHQAPRAIPRGTAADERVPGAVHAAAAEGNAGCATGVIPSAAATDDIENIAGRGPAESS